LEISGSGGAVKQKHLPVVRFSGNRAIRSFNMQTTSARFTNSLIRNEGNALVQNRERCVLALQLLGTLAILAWMPSNLGKALLLPCWWLLTFRSLAVAELVLFCGANVLFVVLDVMAVKNGVFAFYHPDIWGLPWYEFLMWGFYLLHTQRMVGSAGEPTDRRFGLALALTLIFGVAFNLAPNSEVRFQTTAIALLGTLIFFHQKNDFLRACYMIFIGGMIEFVGVWAGHWGYADAVGVPLWFITMWGGVGIFAGRLIPPLARRVASAPRAAMFSPIASAPIVSGSRSMSQLPLSILRRPASDLRLDESLQAALREWRAALGNDCPPGGKELEK
jgi:hypothetical protein